MSRIPARPPLHSAGLPGVIGRFRCRGAMGPSGPKPLLFVGMIVAQLEFFHSRPIAPTRRIALGVSTLPVEPAPGYGGLLLGAVVARFIGDMDPDLVGDLERLLPRIERGERIPQPALRFRLQDDHIGLLRTRHTIERDNDGSIQYVFDPKRAAPTQHVIAAVYAAGEIPSAVRGPVIETIRRGMRWSGPVGPSLRAHLTGSMEQSSLDTALNDPISWALETLGFDLGKRALEREVIVRRFREKLREAHPDHGAKEQDAAVRISDLTRAKRILLP